VIEALASGLPVAAFDSGAIRELVSEDSGIISQYGGNIWNLDDADADLMVRQLNEKLKNLTELGRNARITAEKMFGLDQMVDKYLAVLMG
jgi:glycosyltransferase involved in cell wall biosynthesis